MESLREILISGWRSSSDQEFKEAFDKAVEFSNNPGNFSKEQIVKDNYLLTANLSWFNPINQFSERIPKRPTIGLFVNGIRPKEILAGEFGAGSEFAALHLMNTLAKKGYYVYIFSYGYFDIQKDWEYTLPCRNPQILPVLRSQESQLSGQCSTGSVISFSSLLQKANEDSKYKLDHLIISREFQRDKIKFRNYAKNIYLWCHDYVGKNQQIEYFPKSIYALTDFHANHIRDNLKVSSKTNIVVGMNGTGLDENMMKEFYDIPKIIRKCIYTSSYARGLTYLLDLWPMIFEQFPDATLEIFYGRDTWGVLKPEQLDEIVKKIEALKGSGVIERGRVHQNELLKEISTASFLLYPYSDFSECFCISGAIAQQIGCIPIVIKKHALVETVYPEHPLIENVVDFSTYTMEMLGKDEDSLRPHREAGHVHARKYTWENAAQIWIDEIFEK